MGMGVVMEVGMEGRRRRLIGVIWIRFRRGIEGEWEGMLMVAFLHYCLLVSSNQHILRIKPF